MFRFGRLQPGDAEEILAWRYPPPYDFYDMGQDPADAAVYRDVDFQAEHLVAERDKQGRLRGFLELTARDGLVEIGLGLRPDETGRGLGQSFVESALAHVLAGHGPTVCRLHVATFNRRAITVYRCAGFREVGQESRRLLGRDWEFLVMERPLGASEKDGAAHSSS